MVPQRPTRGNDPLRRSLTGDIGLAAGTLEQGTTIVEFDNIRVTLP